MTYPFIRFVCKYGRALSFYCGLLCLFLSSLLAYLFHSAWPLLIGILVSVLLGATLRLISEIVEVVADALLPR